MLPEKNHRRYNPLLDEWVIVASNRVSRPWQGNRIDAPSFMPTNETNSLAPGGKRRNNVTTPWYESTYVFDNDFPTFTDNLDEEDSPVESLESGDELFRQMAVSGICRVICYHPDTKKSIATMTLDEVLRKFVLLSCFFFAIFRNFQIEAVYRHFQIFENRGAAVGCSNAHPHGQLWAGNFLPSLPSRKNKCQRCPFPFSMGWLGAPTGPSLCDDNKCWQLHASFHPPLLRSGCIL
ncbi:unnamed protein product [Angiostrongylus costaricensis]|uniref:Galactose-1-phosphate uridylyltransferase n=1 Tax=Angiostrongylus costaricensis TaxID=334426 RepID=A0A0R3PPB7_ANGCS|nr:unnamed protein product [Angiostrongylus costaricensis]